jgi:hypothetical protein
MAQIVPDRVGDLLWRPYKSGEEIDYECEKVVRSYLSLSPAEPLPLLLSTDLLTGMIEAHAERLDLFADLEENVEGATDIPADGPPSVRINRRLSAASHLTNRLRNTLAHEFYHLFFHVSLYQEKWKQMELFCDAGERISCTRETILKGKRVDWREWQAAYGAGALLMPATVLRQLVCDFVRIYRPPPYMVGSRESASVVTFVASRFDVSRDAARVRLLQKGLLTSSLDQEQLSLSWGYGT